MNGAMGQPVSRLDGYAKVTGSARYTADTPIDGVQHAVLVPSTIPHGSVDAIDTATAETSPGVLKVLTHLNTPRLYPSPCRLPRPSCPCKRTASNTRDSPSRSSSPIPWRMRHAAAQVAVVPPGTLPHRLPTALARAATVPSFEPDSRTGDPDAALAAAPVRLERSYRTADRHHNPMEPSATIAQWSADGRLLVHDSVQGVAVDRLVLAMAFGLDRPRCG